MRVNSITLNTGYPKSTFAVCSKAEAREHKRADKYEKNYNDQINTTIKNNSDGRVNFKGGVPLLHRAAEFASYNPLVAESLFAILITCGLRPLTIMATAKTEKEKEKCSYQAAKSISSGLVGLATTALIGIPIAAATAAARKNGAFEIPENIKEQSKQAVDAGVKALKSFISNPQSASDNGTTVKVIKSLIQDGQMNLSALQKSGIKPKEFIQHIKNIAPDIAKPVSKAINGQKVLNNYAKTGKNVADKLLQPIFMILRANITIALVPLILAGATKACKFIKNHFSSNKSSEKAQKEPSDPFKMMNLNVFKTNNEKELFQSFLGVDNHEN